MNLDKLAKGLAHTVGKTVSRIFLVRRGDSKYQIFLCFTDGSHYELYGDGTLSGTRVPDKGSADTLRAQLERDSQSEGFQSREVP